MTDQERMEEEIRELEAEVTARRTKASQGGADASIRAVREEEARIVVETYLLAERFFTDGNDEEAGIWPECLSFVERDLETLAEVADALSTGTNEPGDLYFASELATDVARVALAVCRVRETGKHAEIVPTCEPNPGALTNALERFTFISRGTNGEDTARLMAALGRMATTCLESAQREAISYLRARHSHAEMALRRFPNHTEG